MANMMDYIDWRGDLSYKQSPFNEVDNLIFTYLAYVNLDGIDCITKGHRADLRVVSKQFFEMHTIEELDADRSFVAQAPYIMQKMSESERFKHLMMGNYVNVIDDKKEIQFSALELQLEDGTTYVAFRGTDDTIVGWKEDFNLSKGTVPSEREAVKYLEELGKSTDRPLRVGGHSKGGNLAVYAAASVSPEVQDKIIAIYNNDGPGFTKRFLGKKATKAITPKVVRILPKSSVIGMLLSHVTEPTIIASSQKGILQHDGFSWQVMGGEFVREDELSKKAKVLDDIISKWIDNMDPNELNIVVKDFFSVLEATGAKTLTQVYNGGLKNATIMLQKAADLSPETKDQVEDLIKQLVTHWTELLI